MYIYIYICIFVSTSSAGGVALLVMPWWSSSAGLYLAIYVYIYQRACILASMEVVRLVGALEHLTETLQRTAQGSPLGVGSGSAGSALGGAQHEPPVQTASEDELEPSSPPGIPPVEAGGISPVSDLQEDTVISDAETEKLAAELAEAEAEEERIWTKKQQLYAKLKARKALAPPVDDPGTSSSSNPSKRLKTQVKEEPEVPVVLIDDAYSR